jgi:hypothetical protein
MELLMAISLDGLMFKCSLQVSPVDACGVILAKILAWVEPEMGLLIVSFLAGAKAAGKENPCRFHAKAPKPRARPHCLPLRPAAEGARRRGAPTRRLSQKNS